MNVHDRIDALRREMESAGVDIYIVPTADHHHSEYVGEYFKVRQFLTGFTGSAGTAVITRDKAGLWTDGRYFIQADRQLRERDHALPDGGTGRGYGGRICGKGTSTVWCDRL